MCGKSSTVLNEALARLLEKYQVPSAGSIVLNEGSDTGTATLRMKETGQTVPLLPWRMERRFIELRNLVRQETLEDPSTLRFCAINSSVKTSLNQLNYREFDLCEWISGAKIDSIFAVSNGDQATNIIAKLANGIACSIECSVTLPADATPVDRHEIIARRGVGSDRAVDTQVPQSSIYTFTEKGKKEFTDTDAELFGLDQSQTNLVRAAFTVLSDSDLAIRWNQQHQRLMQFTAAAVKSSQDNRPVEM